MITLNFSQACESEILNYPNSYLCGFTLCVFTTRQFTSLPANKKVWKAGGLLSGALHLLAEFKHCTHCALTVYYLYHRIISHLFEWHRLAFSLLNFLKSESLCSMKQSCIQGVCNTQAACSSGLRARISLISTLTLQYRKLHGSRQVL